MWQVSLELIIGKYIEGFSRSLLEALLPEFACKCRKKPKLSRFWNKEARMNLEATECEESVFSHVAFTFRQFILYKLVCMF
jgi:hypothetical protein